MTPERILSASNAHFPRLVVTQISDNRFKLQDSFDILFLEFYTQSDRKDEAWVKRKETEVGFCGADFAYLPADMSETELADYFSGLKASQNHVDSQSKTR